MADYQLLVSKIRREMAIPEIKNAERFQSLSREYAQACREVNQRLAVCSLFLYNGNPSEAVRLSTSAPDLLEICSVLNFDNLAEWRELCDSIEGLESFEQLMYGTLERLRQAYMNQPRTEFLLSKFRLLSLREGSIEERLSIVYKMKELEPDNNVWDKLIPQFETACAEYFRDVYLNARISKDGVGTINVLISKIKNMPWSEFPSALYNELNKWNRNASIKYSIEKIQSILNELHNAYNEQNLDRAIELDQERINIIRNQRLSAFELPPDMDEKVIPVRNWIAETQKRAELKEEYDRCVDEVLFLLEQDTELSDLEDAFHQLLISSERADLPVPENIQYAIDRRFDSIKRQKQRKTKMILFLAASAGISVAVFLFFYVKTVAFKSAVASECVLLTEKVTAYKAAIFPEKKSQSKNEDSEEEAELEIKPDFDGLDKAEKQLKTLEETNAKVFRSRPVQEISREVSDLRSKEEARVSNFNTEIKKAKDSLTLYEETKKSKSKASASGLLDQQALVNAGKYKITADEAAQIADLDQRFRKLISQERAVQEEQFNLQYNITLKKYNALIEKENISPEFQKELSKLKEEIVAIKTELVAESLKIQKTNLLASVEKKISAIAKDLSDKTFRDNMIDDLQKTIDSLSNSSDYRKALIKIAEKNSDFSAADDFKKTASEIDIQDLFHQWNSLMAENRNVRDLLSLDKNQTKNLKRKLENMKYAKISLEQKESMLKQLNELDNFYKKKEKGVCQIFKELIKYLEKFANDEYYVKIEDKYYYLSKEPVSKGGEYTLIYKINDSDDTEKLTLKLGTARLDVKCAPHTAYVKQISDALKKQADSTVFNPDDTDEAVDKIYRSLILNAEIDPAVQLILFKGITDILIEYPLYCNSLKQWIDVLDENSGFKYNINWHNPDHSELPARREQAINILKNNLTDLNEKMDQVKKERKKYIGLFEQQFQPIGILYKQGDQWACLSKTKRSEITAPLYAVRAGKNPGEGTVLVFQDIVDSCFVKTDKAQENKLLQGLPLYKYTPTK